ncbi:Lrp/AsnC family transcriptional regulator [Mesorhizobium sp. AR07]|uniref:Lrp/AsnC family transcriptional regulator n=1 Tax=Mesorhizobium sp. AR07 TaxID=2865838 RepID=UPI00215F6428|nr:Lrp/AsnC family transcriptional regulator [Mesorhizobium sp. AR07]UVK42180.1 Lrp/AsnC family transcriptional regulator [Mesorhizobium sp. AR07]
MWDFVSTSDLDDTEQAVLSQLKVDGRMSSVDIAKRIGVTEATVRRKMARVLEDPDICIQAVVRPLRSDVGIAAIVGLDVDREHIISVARKLSEYSFVDSVYAMTGPFDIIIQLTLPSTTSLHDFLVSELSNVPGIKDSESYMIGRVFKHSGRAYQRSKTEEKKEGNND